MEIKIKKQNDKFYATGQLKDVADYVSQMIDYNETYGDKKFRFPNFKFAVPSNASKEDINIAQDGNNHWYDVVQITMPNQTGVPHLTVVCDIVGGSLVPGIGNLYQDESIEFRRDTLADLMLVRADGYEGDTNYASRVIAVWEEKDFIPMYEIAEMCPYCDSESEFAEYEKIGKYAARCKHCGRIIMLCSICPYLDRSCNDHEVVNGRSCHCGTVVETFIPNEEE